MTFDVVVTRGAERDLAEIVEFSTDTESEARATDVFDRLVAAAASLSNSPQRGRRPRELEALGVREYRQVVVTPYRIIYRVVETRVVILIIADGRRDMQTLLAQRLLRM